MKASLILIVLALVEWQYVSLADIDLGNIEENMVDGHLKTEFVEELLNKVAASDKSLDHETVVTLKATKDDEESFREINMGAINPTNFKSVKLNQAYERQQELVNETFKLLSMKYPKMDYDSFYKSAKNARMPVDYCPTVSKKECTDYDLKYRQITAWCNNLKWPLAGAANTPYLRLLPPNYEKYCDTPTRTGKSGYALPEPRAVALEMFRHVETDSKLTSLWTFFAQFFDHDLVLTSPATDYQGKKPDCSSCDPYNKLCDNINIPAYDYYFKYRKCLPLIRNAAAVSVSGDCQFKCREQVTETTQVFDLSSVYGWFDSQASKVRAFYGGLLKFDEYYNTVIPAFVDPKNAKDGCCGLKLGKQCLVSGDQRTEDNGYLYGVTLLYWYEHNRIANEYYKKYPYCSDEVIYQNARRLNIAQFQKHIYNDWLVDAIGPAIARKFDLIPTPYGKCYKGYDEKTPPGVYNELGLAMRFGHTLIKDDYFLADEYCNPIKTMGTMDTWFVANQMVCNNQFDSYSRGLICDNSYYKNDQMTTDLTDHLFEQFFGQYNSSSLSAINVERCRDHGLQPYQELRRRYKLSVSDNFDNLFGFKYETKKKLAKLYYSPDDIDLWVGLSTERSFKNFNPEGGLLGETLAYFVAEQLQRLKKSDRFYWENCNKESNPFTVEQLDHIRSLNIGSLICSHVNIKYLQQNPFWMPSDDNKVVSCSDYPAFQPLNVDLFPIDKECAAAGYNNPSYQNKPYKRV